MEEGDSIQHVQTSPFAVTAGAAWPEGVYYVTGYSITRTVCRSRSDRQRHTCALSSVDGHTQFSRPVPGPPRT